MHQQNSLHMAAARCALTTSSSITPALFRVFFLDCSYPIIA